VKRAGLRLPFGFPYSFPLFPFYFSGGGAAGP
jgi:hypothetical protein